MLVMVGAPEVLVVVVGVVGVGFVVTGLVPSMTMERLAVPLLLVMRTMPLTAVGGTFAVIRVEVLTAK